MAQAPKSSAAVPAAGAEASRLRFGEVKIRNRGRLPHWEKESGLYFITFRLADSLPQQVLLELEKKVPLSKCLPRAELEKSRKQRTRLIETYLDRGAGNCYLSRPNIAELVSSALKFGENRDYRLLAWCVMPNHVHVVAKLFPSRKLATVLHSWKSYTAKRANKLLSRTGGFWEREYYDRLIRTENELGRILRYISNNPTKAGLENWQWIEMRGQDARATAGEDAGATG